MAHIFISYSRADSHFARLLKLELEKDFDLWIDTERLLAGDDWRVGIDEAIQEAYALIVVMSPDSAASRYVTYEWAFALGIGVKVIPLLIKPHTDFHPRLDVLQRFDFTNPDPALQPWPRLIERLHEIREDQNIRIPIPRNAPREVKKAITALNSLSANERIWGAEALGHMRNPMAVPALVETLKDRSSNVRSAAATALVEIGDASVPLLLDTLYHQHIEARRDAASALSRIGITAVPGLLNALRSSDLDIRQHASTALVEIGDSAVPGLLDALRDLDSYVSQAAADALERIGTKTATDAINQWWKEQDSE